MRKLKNLKKKSKFFFRNLIITLLILLQGCFLAPAIQSFKEIGVTEQDRTVLLSKRLKSFHETLYWGNPNDALQFIEPSKQADLKAPLRDFSKDEKVVDSKVEETDLSEEAKKASVKVVVRSYKIPFYIVRERTMRQEWVFDISNGWLVTDLKEEKS